MRFRFLLCGILIWHALPHALAAEETTPPREGLRLWLVADQGVESSDGDVSRWTDQSGHGLDGKISRPYQSPQTVSAGEGIAFSQGRLLRISGELIPQESHSMTVVAVGRADAVPGVSLVVNRKSHVPLVQLDVDEAGMARFIVRDKASRTLRSLALSEPGKTSVFIGILTDLGQGRFRVQVHLNGREGDVAEGELSTPLTGDTTWLGGLPLGNRLYTLGGILNEVLVYDRAFEPAQIDGLSEQLMAKYDIEPPPPPKPDSFNVLDPAHSHQHVARELTTDVCIVGGGSAGIGAAIAAARRGVRVVLVERQKLLGGTGTNAFVSAWEPGPGCAIAEEIFHRMQEIPEATGVATFHAHTSKISMGQWYITKGAHYSMSTRRAGVPKEKMAAVPYSPQAFDHVVRQMLHESGNVNVLDETVFFQAQSNTDNSRVESILVEDASKRVTQIRAKVFIDCTGCVYLCRALGCETMLGVDAQDRFNESVAPKKGFLQLNAISRCYRVRPSKTPTKEPAPKPPVPGFARSAHVTGHKDGLRVVNPLPMLPGRALIDLGYDECLRRTDKAVRAHWHWLQQHPEFAGYEFDTIAPMLGIRESYRVVTRYVLRQSDLEAGLPRQTHNDIVAVADHPCDIHGAGGHLTAVQTAYGVPYRCLIPQGDWQNLLVACRGSGFSKIAASSCRLQRTIIQLGHAAGIASAMAVEANCSLDEIDIPDLVQTLDAPSRYRDLTERAPQATH